MAKILGITDRRLRQLCCEGMPRASRGCYPLVSCTHWYVHYCKRRIGRRVSKTKEKLLLAQINWLEFKIARAKGTVIERKDCIEELSLAHRRFRSELRRIPSRLAEELRLADKIKRRLEERLDDLYWDFQQAFQGYIDQLGDTSH